MQLIRHYDKKMGKKGATPGIYPSSARAQADEDMADVRPNTPVIGTSPFRVLLSPGQEASPDREPPPGQEGPVTDDELRASIPELTRGQRADATRRSPSRGASQQQASPRRSRSRERPTPSLSPAPKSARGSPEWGRGETKAQREAKASSDAVDPLGATPGPMPPMPQISQSMQTPAPKGRGRPRTTLTTGAEEADPVSKRSCTPAGGAEAARQIWPARRDHLQRAAFVGHAQWRQPGLWRDQGRRQPQRPARRPVSTSRCCSQRAAGQRPGRGSDVRVKVLLSNMRGDQKRPRSASVANTRRNSPSH